MRYRLRIIERKILKKKAIAEQLNTLVTVKEKIERGEINNPNLLHEINHIWQPCKTIFGNLANTQLLINASANASISTQTTLIK